MKKLAVLAAFALVGFMVHQASACNWNREANPKRPLSLDR